MSRGSASETAAFLPPEGEPTGSPAWHPPDGVPVGSTERARRTQPRFLAPFNDPGRPRLVKCPLCFPEIAALLGMGGCSCTRAQQTAGCRHPNALPMGSCAGSSSSIVLRHTALHCIAFRCIHFPPCCCAQDPHMPRLCYVPTVRSPLHFPCRECSTLGAVGLWKQFSTGRGY